MNDDLVLPVFVLIGLLIVSLFGLFAQSRTVDDLECVVLLVEQGIEIEQAQIACDVP